MMKYRCRCIVSMEWWNIGVDAEIARRFHDLREKVWYLSIYLSHSIIDSYRSTFGLLGFHWSKHIHLLQVGRGTPLTMNALSEYQSIPSDFSLVFIPSAVSKGVYEWPSGPNPIEDLILRCLDSKMSALFFSFLFFL